MLETSPQSVAGATAPSDAPSDSIRRVLGVVDGSPAAEAALPHALALARAFDAELWVLRVLESQPEFGAVVDPIAWRLARSEAKAYLRALAERLAGHGPIVRVEFREGEATAEILELASHHQVGLIVLSAHGETGKASQPPSTTAQQVILRSDTSVLLVRNPGAALPANWEQPLYRRIAVPVDGSKRAEWALYLAASVARSQGAELVLVSVAPIPETVRRPPLERRAQRLVDELAALNRRWTDEYLEKMKQLLSASGLTVRTVASSGCHVRNDLDPLLNQEKADLVVVSAHGASGNQRGPLGSVSSHLLHHGTTPLVVFQDQSHGNSATKAVDPTGHDSRLPPRSA